jgi:hypothetical protein
MNMWGTTPLNVEQLVKTLAVSPHKKPICVQD